MASSSRSTLHRRHWLATALAGISAKAHGAQSTLLSSPLRDIHVIVVGAGMAGLAAACAVEELGATVTVMEAASRIGGRNWTLRPGDAVQDIANSAQTCAFSSGQYFNAGAWRVMPWHHRLIRLVQRHAIALEPTSADGATPTIPSMQPAGGMDRLPHAMAQALLKPVQTSTKVLAIRPSRGLLPSGVSVLAQSVGSLQWHDADYAIVTIPLGLLHGLEMTLTSQLRLALQGVQAADAIKVAFEAREPIATNSSEELQGVRLMWPSGDTPVSQRICSVYGNASAIETAFAKSRPLQIAHARNLLHAATPRYKLEFQAPLVVQWSRIPFARAAAMRLTPQHTAALQQLQAGLPPIFFAGDALSSRNGWQEGALESAEEAVTRLLKRHR